MAVRGLLFGSHVFVPWRDDVNDLRLSANQLGGQAGAAEVMSKVILTDVRYPPSASVVEHEESGTGWSIRQLRLKGGLRDGVELIEVEAGGLSFSVLPTRGMGLW